MSDASTSTNVWLHPHSRYGLCRAKQQANGAWVLDPLSRPCMQIVQQADLEHSAHAFGKNGEEAAQHTLHVVTQAGETPFCLAQRLYGDARLFWVVCEALALQHPFQHLPPQRRVTVLHPDALSQRLQAGAKQS